ncbi:MAG TPA: 3-isopropylmalate dehydratase [Gemmatimonadales bacterium]|jgi:3-isopropylmalate/(R)-2-methylmalate dehydratase small subunit
MPITLDGRARRLGDDINTDYIISSARKKESIDGEVLKEYLLERIDPEFARSVRPGDVIVAGRNFGCGSAMEVAVTVIQASGIVAVVAASFSRSFFRNAINNGLLVIECDTAGITDGDQITVTAGDAAPTVEDRTLGLTRRGAALPPIMQEILGAGGLVPYLRQRGNFAGDTRRGATGSP